MLERLQGSRLISDHCRQKLGWQLKGDLFATILQMPCLCFQGSAQTCSSFLSPCPSERSPREALSVSHGWPRSHVVLLAPATAAPSLPECWSPFPVPTRLTAMRSLVLSDGYLELGVWSGFFFCSQLNGEMIPNCLPSHPEVSLFPPSPASRIRSP